MKNRHGFDVKRGQVWMRGDDRYTVVGIEPCMRGHRVVVSHEPWAGFAESTFALSKFGTKLKLRSEGK